MQGILVVLILMAMSSVTIGYAAYNRGTRPMRRLKPGTYTVEAFIRGEDRDVLLAVRWHVDYGHYEDRLARLPWASISGAIPAAGDELKVDRQFPGIYYVHPAKRAVAV